MNTYIPAYTYENGLRICGGERVGGIYKLRVNAELSIDLFFPKPLGCLCLFFNDKMKTSTLLAAALCGVAAVEGAVLWDGRFNDFTSSADLNKWSWANQVGPYRMFPPPPLPLLTNHMVADMSFYKQRILHPRFRDGKPLHQPLA